MPKYLLIVKADTNDADYVYKTTEVEEKDNWFNVELIEKVSSAIKKSPQRHNWDNSEYKHKHEKDPYELYKDILTKDEIQEFEENYCPFGEYGIHTIKSIELYEISSKKSLL